jgi:hypothetical protein
MPTVQDKLAKRVALMSFQNFKTNFSEPKLSCDEATFFVCGLRMLAVIKGKKFTQ